MSSTQEIVERARMIQSSKIVQPILENLRRYGLENIISFIYQGALMDVEILAPKFDYGLHDRESDLEQVGFLLKKHGIAMPSDIKIHQNDVQRQNETRSSVKYFENWLMGHLLYVDLEEFTVESVYYSPRVGLLVKLQDLDPIPDTTAGIPVNICRKEETVKKPTKTKTEKRKPHSAVAIPQKKRIKSREPIEEWKKTNPGFLWVKEQLAMGRARKEIILEFNNKHKSDPENYSSRDGKELSAAILSHWSKMV